MSGKNKTYRYQDLLVIFDESEFKKTIIKEMSRSNKETGGIITGNYINNLTTAMVNKFHNPPIDSIRKRDSFIRGKQGLNSLLKKLWGHNQYYLGEWHVHPFAKPNASEIDIKQIKEISHTIEYKCPEPIMIIVGYQRGEISYNVYIIQNGELIKMEEIN